MHRQALAALEFDVVDLQRDLGICACVARLRYKHVPYQLRAFGNFGSVGGLDV